MNPFTLSRGELCALLRVASRDETRIHLAGLCFDWKRGTVSATDGHMLLEFTPGSPGGVGRQLIERGILRRLARTMDAFSSLRVELEENVTVLTVVDQGGGPELRCAVKRTDVDAPPYEQVIPATVERAKVTPRIAFSMRFAARMNAIARCIDRHGNAGATMHVPAGPLDPIKFTFEGDSRWVAVLMPMTGAFTAQDRSAAE